MNRYRMALCMALAGMVLACCAVVLAWHSEPGRASFANVAAGEDDPGLIQHAIWQGGDVEATWRFETIQFREDTAPGASEEAPGVRLLDYDVPPAGRWWAWTLFFVAAGGFFLWLHRPRPHGRIIAVRVRHGSRPAPRRRRRG